MAVPISSEGQWRLELFCFYYFQYNLQLTFMLGCVRVEGLQTQREFKAFNRKESDIEHQMR